MSEPAPRKRVRRRRRRPLPWRVLIATHVAVALLAAVGVWLVRPAGVRTALPSGGLDPTRTAPEKYAWTLQPEPRFPIPPYAAHLKGVRIVLDPGHIGQRDRPNWKRGPTGLREAEANFRVARFLSEFLEAVGAEVIFTRDKDVSLDLDDDVDLMQRAEIANAARADLLLSIHHNAAEAPEANYTSVWYHESPDHSPPSLDAGRFLVTGLNDALRLEQHIGVPLLADTLIYQRSGFAVLRFATVPAILCESSFHSNLEEEERLRDPVYNRREAYGMFLGLARWAQAGLPRIRVADAPPGRWPQNGTVTVQLDDGLSDRGGMGGRSNKIQTGSLVVRLNGNPVEYTVDWRRQRVTINVPSAIRRREGTIHVDFENIFGQHVLHPTMEFGPQNGES